MLALLREVLWKAKKALTKLSGVLIHFTLEQSKKAKKLVLKYSPAQDLNGYTEPWTGGNGKNLCPPLTIGKGVNANTGALEDNAAKARTDYIPVDFATNHRYYISGLVSDLFYFTAAYNASKQFLGRTGATAASNASLSSASFTAGTPQGSGDIAYLIITQYENSLQPGTIDEVSTATTQLEAGSSATTYEPYENIGTPTTYSNEYVIVSKKNMVSMTLDQIKTLNTGGTWAGDVYSYRGIDWSFEVQNGVVTKVHSEGTATGNSLLVPGYYLFRKGINVILNGSPASGSGSKWRLYVSDTGVSGYDTGSGRSITPTADVRAQLRAAVYTGNTVDFDWYPMIRRGDVTDATFEPFDGDVFYSNYGGFYGGEYDMITGKRLVQYKTIDFGDMTWSYSTTAVSGIGVFVSNNVMDRLAGSADFICSGYKVAGTSRGNLTGVKSGIAPYNSTTSKSFVVRNDYYTDANVFKAAMTGIKIIYRMETPEIQDKAAFEITMAPGEKNVVVRRATDMTLVYESEE